MCHSDIASNDNIFSLFTNPAGHALNIKREIGFYYSPAPFGLNQLSNFYSAYKEPTRMGNLSLGIKHFGFSLYKENQIWFAYSNSIENHFHYGFSIQYNSTSIKRYGQSGVFNLSIGGIVKFSESTLIGFSLANPLRNPNSIIELPFTLSIGLSHYILSNSSINFTTVKELEFPFSYRFGVKYEIIKFIDLRIGLQNKPNIYSGGIGINYNLININYSISAHLDLGFSHQFDIILNLD